MSRNDVLKDKHSEILDIKGNDLIRRKLDHRVERTPYAVPQVSIPAHDGAYALEASLDPVDEDVGPPPRIVGAPRPVYVANVDEAENIVEAREQSMQLQLDGGSAAVTVDDAARGLTEARQELAGRGADYGLGFGYVKNFGSPRGLDGIRLEYAITDGARTANLHVIISGTRLGILGYTRQVDHPDDDLRVWVLDQCYLAAGAIAQSDDRYATLLSRHPFPLG